MSAFLTGCFFFAIGVLIWITGTRDRTGFPIVGNVVDNKREKSRQFHPTGPVWYYRPVIDYSSPTAEILSGDS